MVEICKTQIIRSKINFEMVACLVVFQLKIKDFQVVVVTSLGNVPSVLLRMLLGVFIALNVGRTRTECRHVRKKTSEGYIRGEGRNREDIPRCVYDLQ